MARMHDNTIASRTPEPAPLAMLPETGAPYPHTKPFHWIDEYEAQVGRHHRRQIVEAIVESAIGLRGKLVDLGARSARSARPSFPVGGLPAALRSN